MSTFFERKAAHEHLTAQIEIMKRDIETLGDLIAEGEIEAKKLPPYATKSNHSHKGLERVINKLRDFQAHSFAEKCYARMGL